MQGGPWEPTRPVAPPLQEVGRRMGLETHKLASLWKDRAVVEINVAVLHSFQVRRVLWVWGLSDEVPSGRLVQGSSPDSAVHSLRPRTSSEHPVCAKHRARRGGGGAGGCRDTPSYSVLVHFRA